MNYTFNSISSCNMCGASEHNFKVMGIRLNTSQGFRPKSKIGVGTTIVKCKNCELVFANPQPIPSSISEQYDTSPSDYWKEDFLTNLVTNKLIFDKEISIFKELSKDLIAPHKALDVGAGLGGTMLAFERHGFEAFGFEPSEQFYKFAIDKMNISPSKLQLGTIEDASYPENYFNFITFGAVLEHVHDPRNSLSKALNWLKPGGIIHIEVPSSSWLIGRLYNLYFQWLARTNYVTNISPMHSPFHHYEFTKKSFEENGLQLGYKIVYFQNEVCGTQLPTKKLDFLLKPLMKATNTGLQLIIFLQKNQ
jgi:2-polyprenyl-3-methyl-5-hydroxy-6-metoxy-1,4-benzoquinol methylase